MLALHGPVAAHAARSPRLDRNLTDMTPDAADPTEHAEQAPAVDAPPTFADLGLSDSVLQAIAEMGYRHPTPIQAQAIPVVLMGRDVLGAAQTGTGKTASFTLPLLDILSGSRARARMPRSLILEPTRELALQVAENFVQYGKFLKLTHALVIGGESMSDQKDVLMRGVDVLIATPGRLIDMFERGTILLSDVKILVIDEADRMLDMGFIPDVERIVAMLPRTRQTLFFSATMLPEIRRLADAFLQNPKEISVSRPASVATTITEGLVLVAQQDKREALRRLIRNQKVQNALIFCNRKRDVDILYKSLARHKFSVGALHGDMTQSIRFATLEKFKANELQLLVCSDVAARGLDIGGLSHVFNFDVPHHAEDYVHRIGRTGRAGLEGHAFTIAEPEDRAAVAAIEALIRHPIQPMPVEGLDPIDWAPDDGKRRRGRGGRTATPAPARSRAPKAAPAGEPGEKRPPRARAPRREQPAGGTLLDVLPLEATAIAAAPAAETIEEFAAPQTAPDIQAGIAPGGEAEAERVIETRPEGQAPRDRSRGRSRREAAPTPPRQAAQRPAPQREAQPAAQPRTPDRPHDRDRDRSGPRRRDDDLGPAVTGFGADVPAFMLVRFRPADARPAAPIEEMETEA